MILRLIYFILLTGLTFFSGLEDNERNGTIVQDAASNFDGSPQENDVIAFISWREMVDSIINMTKTIQNSVERSTKELDLTMQVFHGRNSHLFEQMKQSHEESNQAWKEAFEKQAEIFKNQVNRAFQQVSSVQALDAKDRFTVLHYTESITLSRLYRILRAKQQVESQGHRYELLYFASVENEQTERGMRIVKDLMPRNFTIQFFTLGDGNLSGNSSIVDIVRFWYVHRNNREHDRGDGQPYGPPSSDQFWVVSLDLEWLGSLPQALYNLQGRETIKPAFRYPPDFIGVGCVSANRSVALNAGPPVTLIAAAENSTVGFIEKSPTTNAHSFGMRAFARSLLSALRFLSPRRLIHWLSQIFSTKSRKEHIHTKEKDFCYSDVWRISGDLITLNVDFLSVSDYFNAAQARGKVIDARAHGLEFGLLSPRAFPRPTCVRTFNNVTSCHAGNITKAEFISAKEQYRLLRVKGMSGIVYAPPGVLFRASDQHDFELHV